MIIYFLNQNHISMHLTSGLNILPTGKNLSNLIEMLI